MTNGSQPPDRIKPFYETNDPGKPTVLIDEPAATLKQGDVELIGAIQIVQEWSPVGVFWNFACADTHAVDFGEVELKSKSFTAKGRLFSRGQSRVAGYIEDQVELGSDHKLDRVTFHLPDYPEFTYSAGYADKIIDNGTTTRIRWNEVVLESDGWRIRLQPLQRIHALRLAGHLSQRVVISDIGELRRSDGSGFKKKEAKRILEALRFFLSFAFAGWSPPLLVVGSNDVAPKSWRLWSNYTTSPNPFIRGWLDEHHPQHLADAFPGFIARWSQEKWREPLELAITWFIEASSQSGGVQGTIAFTQIPLEMLAWLVFVDDRTIVEHDEFDRLSAASKLQMLLAHCGVPFDVPICLPALTKLSTNTKFNTGPQLLTKVRNTVIHPNQKNRKVLADWEQQHSVNVADARWDSQQLFKHYLTLVLLYLTGYSGEYANRLTHRKQGHVEWVPWASSPVSEKS